MDAENLKSITDTLLDRYPYIFSDLDLQVNANKKIIPSVVDYYENIILAMPGNVFWLDKNCRGVGCSRDVLDMLGFSSISEFRGLNFDDMGRIGHWSPEAIRSFKEDSLSVARTGKPKLNIEEPPIPHSNGKLIYFLTNRVPLFDTKGNIIGVVGISLDITELKSTQVALKKAKEEAEAASLAKSEFVANMSHDLKTPLSGIIGLSELLTFRLKAEENLEFAQSLLASGRQLLNFFDNCLEIFKMETGDIALTTERFILTEVLDEIAELFTPAIKSKELHFSISYDPRLPAEIIGSRAGIYRVLLNLVGNAVKFTHKGSVAVNVTRSEKSSDTKLIVEFAVEDTGIGIPKDKQDIIFDRFTRLIPSYKGTYEGTGIGLFIVNKFVKTMNGSVIVESEKGKGSRFTITLPFESATSKMIETIPIASPRPSNIPTPPHRKVKTTANANRNRDASDAKIKILLVEDNYTAQLIESSLLSSMNCLVDIVDNGERALEVFEPGLYDLIFMDIGLPGMQGDTTAKIIRKIEQGSGHHVPIVALTAHITEDMNNHCLTAGIDCVLSKPLYHEQAKKIIDRFYSES